MTLVDLAKSDHDLLTNRLLGASIDIFAERGLDKAGVAAIARRAGVSTGAIYSRWAGKQEMLLDALDLVMTAELSRLLTADGDASVADILESLGADLLVREHATDALLMEAVSAAHRDPEFRTMLNVRFAEQEERLAVMVDQGKASGVIDPALPTDALVALCHAISLGFVVFANIDKPLPAAGEWTTVIQRIIRSALPPTPSDTVAESLTKKGHT